MENGLTVVTVEDHRSPIVHIEMAIRAGSASDPPDRPGLSEATVELLTEGAGSRSGEDLALAIEALGAQVDSFVTEDYSGISATVVSENVDRLIDLFLDVVLEPRFPEHEVELYKSNRLAELKVQRQDPAFLAIEHLNKVVYGSHPYAIVAPTPSSISSLTRRDIESFYRAHYIPDGAVLVIAGDFTSMKMESQLMPRLSEWRGLRRKPHEIPRIPEIEGRRIYLINRPGSEQADILIGNIAVPNRDESYFPLLVANAVLGAGSSSRLFMKVREERGFSYDVYSEIRAPLMPGLFLATAQSRPEVVVPTIRLTLTEIRRIQTRLITADELRAAKNYLNGVFSLSLSTQGGLAERLAHAHMMGVGTHHLQQYRERVEAVTRPQLREAARRHMLPDRCAIVIVGDATGLQSRLRTLGPVVSVKSAN